MGEATLADVGRQLKSSQHRENIQNVCLSLPFIPRASQIPKFPGRWVDQSKHPLKTELGNRLLTLRVTWREMLRHKGLKMRGREWM